MQSLSFPLLVVGGTASGGRAQYLEGEPDAALQKNNGVRPGGEGWFVHRFFLCDFAVSPAPAFRTHEEHLPA